MLYEHNPPTVAEAWAYLCEALENQYRCNKAMVDTYAAYSKAKIDSQYADERVNGARTSWASARDREGKTNG